MSTSESLLKQGPLVQAKYSVNNGIILVWNMAENMEAEAVYHSIQQEFMEVNSTLLDVQIQPVGAAFTRTLSPGRNYYHVKFKDGSVSTINDRMIHTDGVINFRDMGGYLTEDGRTTRWGMLLRSADLHELSKQDLHTADVLGIDWICDLRSDFEVASRPSPAIGKALNTNIPFMAEANPEEMQKIGHDLHAGYKAMILNTDKCTLILNELLKEERDTSLFHCAAGKDRTGVVCALILLTLGVPREVVIEDYELTNLAVDGLMQRFLSESNKDYKEYMDHMPELKGAIPEMMKAAFIQAIFEAIDEKYGSFELYLSEGLGINEEQRTALQNKYLI
ncbi:tyrosine-protein phosphatase [Paenibacillus sp. F6_3S_P_1C]|uniref:Tyrosine-protein phosphatase n=1 Tax=Paenibacillus vandeheii TaxID=3035917 RepID=A0ABT8JDS0_9BACL|nr:tyrosine-protein phosphatase [Paenibacillus vandeheii]MDN4603250.1 tyrosine-protein phosphatase [Paenibacillus vandeheii]